MIVRIVQMTFKHTEVDYFIEEVFNRSKSFIRNFEGCNHLELHRDATKKNILYTYSIWDNEDCLNVYRNSELFKTTWDKTKVLFADKPKAFSLEKMEEVLY
ncbi:MAG: antibiotic biosynthesis monooxygenase [Bacteroidota bacterium]|nr:antibiotic biosynthesis monooxygenase [Bacteroidota bacterium]